MESRRDFFQQLIAGGATVTSDLKGKPLKHRKADKSPNVRVYHGPFFIPTDVAECIREEPDLHKTRGGGTNKLVAKYVDGSGVKWLIKCRVPDSRAMVGEIIETPEGDIRVHAWTIARPPYDTFRDARALIANRASAPAEEQAPIMPPLPSPVPDWDSENSALLSHLME